MHNSLHWHHCPSRWRPFLLWLVVVALLVGGCGTEQPRVYRVGILSGLEIFSIVIDSFKADMTRRGYIEGQHISYDIHLIYGDKETFGPILQQFVAEDVDLIFVLTTGAAVAAKAATEGTDIPVVFAFAATEETGLIESVREPGGNITGVRLPGPNLALQRFEILHELAPEAERIWMPYQRDYPTIAGQMELLHPAAEKAGVTLLEAPAADAAELKTILKAQATRTDPGLDAILLLPEPLSGTEDAFAVIAQFAEKHRVPIGGGLMPEDDYGSLFSVHINNQVAGQQVASLVDKIFHGTPAGTIPVLSTETYLEINYRVAEDLGITIPEGLLKQADNIIR